MLVIWNSSSSVEIESTRFKLLQRYDAFDLVDFLGQVEELSGISHTVTENQPIYVNGSPVTIPRGNFAVEGHPRTLIRFAGPITRRWQKLIKAFKIKIHFLCPPYGMCVEFPRPEILQQLVERLPLLIASAPYTQEHCTRRTVSLPLAIKNLAGVSGKWVDLVFFTQTDRDRIKTEFEQSGKRVVAESLYKLRLENDMPLTALRDLKGVKLVDETRPVITASLELLDAIGLPQFPMTDSHEELSGQGQFIAVADTGLDWGLSEATIHPDFTGRVHEITSWPINESWNQYVTQPGHDDGAVDSNTGHGTHVAGLALGSGEASQGHYRGVAPKAKLVFQAIEQFTKIKSTYAGDLQSGYYLSGRPLDLRDLFSEARELGARIHVNAWGDPSQGGYTDDCYEADDFLAKHQDAIILFAAGNDGADKDGNRRIDARSLYSPASAKNVIAIGATEGPRQGVGLRVNWDAFDDARNKRFANSDDRRDAISGEPEHIALISSAGPTRDGRIKPDLCAPGTNLAAPRSQATSGNGWGLASPLPYYMYYGGTSMATGAAGGYFALLRQAWQSHLSDVAPSGAALKALAILAAHPILRRDSLQEEPRNIGGFGSIHLAKALPTAENGIRLVDFREPGLHTGETKTFSFRLNQEQEFKAVLCWYDAPGEVLINDLDLSLECEGVVYRWGNHDGNETGQPDRQNTVELIQVSALKPGNYTLRVTAANIPAGPQAFALVFNSPADKQLTIPLSWISGIGSAFEEQLISQGVSSINQLLNVTLENLQMLLNRKGQTTQNLYTRLVLLEERLNWTLPLHMPAELNLSQLMKTSNPAVPNEEWQLATRYLSPLIQVFNRNRHKQIQLSDLYQMQG